MAIFIGFLVGCTVTQRNLEVFNEERPVSAFDRYELGIGGVSKDTNTVYALWCNVEFRPRIPSKGIELDTIPVFLIDSICVEGGCVDTANCRKAYWRKDEEEVDTVLARLRGHSGDDYYYGTNRIWSLADDIYKVRGYLEPEDFFVYPGIHLPVSCDDSTGVMILYIRLKDRVTSEIVAQMSKTVTFKVRKKKVWYNWNTHIPTH